MGLPVLSQGAGRTAFLLETPVQSRLFQLLKATGTPGSCSVPHLQASLKPPWNVPLLFPSCKDPRACIVGDLSAHLKILNLISLAKSPVPCKVTFTGSRD